MSDNVFLNKDELPAEPVIQEKLGDIYPVLNEIRDFVKTNIGEPVEDWKFYGKKIGWTLKTLIGKRNLFFITIAHGFFKMSFVFGQKAIDKINSSEINEVFKNALNEARKYAEGRGLLIEVRNSDNIADIKELIQIKVSN